MLSLNILYNGKDEFLNALTENGFNTNDVCFVRIYTAVCTKPQAVELAREIKGILPYSKIVGASASGVILNGKQYDEHTLVVIEKYEHTEVIVKQISFKDKKAAEVAQELKDTINGKTVGIVHTLCSNRYSDVHNFVEAFNTTHSHIKLVGGIVGDLLPTNDEGFVFTDEGIFEYSILIGALCGDIHTFNDVILNHDPISPIYTLNECKGSIISTVEHIPAVTWSREQFGMENFDSFDYDWQVIAENDALIRFQMILEGHSGASRFVRYDAQAGEMSLYFSQLNDGTKFRIGYTSPTKCVQQCYELCNKILKSPVESMFVYSCLFRKLYLGNCAEWEIRPFLNHNLAGAFMMGEISHINGRNEFLNGTCCIVAVAEEENIYHLISVCLKIYIT